jgi:hypothetical protein
MTIKKQEVFEHPREAYKKNTEFDRVSLTSSERDWVQVYFLNILNENRGSPLKAHRQVKRKRFSVCKIEGNRGGGIKF